MNLLPEIKKRKSSLLFKEKEVSKEDIKLLIEAARWAPSSFNNQPWNYIFVSKKDPTREKLEDALMAGNSWAKKASHLVVVSCNPKDDSKSNNVEYCLYDCGLSVMNLTIQAEYLGLRVHQMAGFNVKEVRTALNILDSHKVIVVFALGYEDKSKLTLQKVNEKLRARLTSPRTRKEVKENFFFGRYSK